VLYLYSLAIGRCSVDGERCGETLRSLFENAANPDKVFVGLFEQNAPEDKFCREQYCSYFGSKTLKRQTIRQGVVKVMANSETMDSCPHKDQIRLIAYHDIQAKGPTYARSLVRKALGNEEFCMQIDAHTEFVPQWDKLAVSEWKNTENEFGILSTVPAAKAEMESYASGGAKFTEVPRQCSLKFQSNGIPVSVHWIDRLGSFDCIISINRLGKSGLFLTC
jgi:Glycosyltransferase (GlcNAc)